MHILFICGCLEPGRDGVGDYTNGLGRELIRLGHDVRILAINDSFVVEPTNVSDIIHGRPFEAFRLPAKMTWSIRGEFAIDWLAGYRSDWVSLQFVPFSFHPRGLKLGLGDWLIEWIPTNYWHVMFHETWVGFSRVLPFRHRILGAIQRLLVVKLIMRLRPAQIHTSNLLYQEVLDRAGIVSNVLAIPSSIPKAAISARDLSVKLNELGINIEERNNWFILGSFGTIHPGGDYKCVFSKLISECDRCGKRLALILIGRTGREGRRLLCSLNNEYGSRILIRELGERSPEDVSAYFQLIDKGFITILKPFMGKSSVVAAMRFHGLEIIGARDCVLPEFNHLILDSASEIIAGDPGDFSVNKIAKFFLTEIGEMGKFKNVV
jgi:hypothetical protein